MASVQALIKQGANVNAVEDREAQQGQTPLMTASYSGDTPIVAVLLAAGAQVNAQNRVKYSIGMTPLMWAGIGNGFDKPGTITLLLRHRADAEVQAEYGRSALMYAGAEGDAACVLALIKGGAKVNAANKYGETALSYTAANGRFDNFAAFIRCGADVNAKENDGSTPLINTIQAPCVHHDSDGFAVTQAEAVKMLLVSGANVNAVDAKHMTPLAYAIKKEEPQVINLLRQAGAKK